MGITNSNKELNVSSIDCGGTFRVKLSLTAEPNILTAGWTDWVWQSYWDRQLFRYGKARYAAYYLSK